MRHSKRFTAFATHIFIIIFPSIYFSFVDHFDLNLFCSFTKSTWYGHDQRLLFDNRPSLILPVVAGLLASAMWVKDSKYSLNIDYLQLSVWTATGLLLNLWAKNEYVFFGKSSTLLFGVLTANALFFANLLCQLQCELIFSARLLQYGRWLVLLFIYYYCIWLPPFLDIYFVRCCVILAIGIAWALPAGRAYLKQHTDVLYLSTLILFHAIIMLASQQEILI